MKFKIRTLVFTFGCLALILYFSYHMITGGRGIIAYFQLKSEISNLYAELDQVRAERLNLEHKANLLKSQSLDIDLLEQRAKEVLGYAKPHEVLFITSEE